MPLCPQCFVWINKMCRLARHLVVSRWFPYKTCGDTWWCHYDSHTRRAETPGGVKMVPIQDGQRHLVVSRWFPYKTCRDTWWSQDGSHTRRAETPGGVKMVPIQDMQRHLVVSRWFPYKMQRDTWWCQLSTWFPYKTCRSQNNFIIEDQINEM